MRTVRAMIALYCRDHHGTRGEMCPQCEWLADYAVARLDRCPFGSAKTTCARCPVHCYKPEARSEIKLVMRYAGPRMLWRHPLLALRHQWEEWRARRAIAKEKRHAGA